MIELVLGVSPPVSTVAGLGYFAGTARCWSAEAETGGYRQSGLGRLHGYDGLTEFTGLKHICLLAGVVDTATAEAFVRSDSGLEPHRA
jgi:hypothetical protein